MSQIKIQKVKLIKGERLEVSYQINRDDKSQSSISEARDTHVHPDLKAVLQKLAQHIAVLCEFHTAKSSKAENALKTFIVTGYSVGGSEDEEGVVITGYKLTKAGQSFTLNTPFTKYEQDDAGAYPLLQDLNSDIAELESEVLLFLDGSKKAPDPQLSMFDNQTDDIDEDIQDKKSSRIPRADPEAMKRVAAMDDEEQPAPKKRGRKKNS